MYKVISILDFTNKPECRHGRNGGFRFRKEFLLPALRSGNTVIVDLDGVNGYAESFLDEAFGKLIADGISESYLTNSLILKSVFSGLVSEVWELIHNSKK